MTPPVAAARAPTSEGKRNLQLDALRAFSVLGIMLNHFRYPYGPFQWLRPACVQLLFVLSGFLTTTILLHCRDLAAKSASPPWFTAKRFYIRRALRIFPIYYFVILLGVLFDVAPVRELFWWLATFTQNIYISLENQWMGRFSHLWSLAVQEQFYLAWPFLVLATPRRWLVPLLIGLIWMGPFYRIYGVATNAPHLALKCFTLTTLDALASGALLAYLIWSGGFKRFGEKKFAVQALWLAGTILAVSLHFWLAYQTTSRLHTVFFNTAVITVCCGMLHTATTGYRGILGKVLEWPPLTYLGRISYGIYVYHFFMPPLMRKVWNLFKWPYEGTTWLMVGLAALATTLVASLSWKYLEEPIAGFKRYFPFSPV